MAARDTTGGGGGLVRRLTTETKQAFKTTEFWVYVVVLLMILIAGNQIEGEEGGPDIFDADNVWLYVTILTVGYMISRGLAKAGSRDPYWDAPSADSGDAPPLTERVKSAATVLKEGEQGGSEQHSGSPGQHR